MAQAQAEDTRKHVPIRCTLAARKAIKRGALERGTDIPTEIERLIAQDVAREATHEENNHARP